MAPYQRHIVGREGEDVACTYLIKKGYDIVERNYRKKWGELDIVAKRAGVLYLVEVKTKSCDNISALGHDHQGYRPEENIHPWKLARLGRAIQSYLAEPSTVKNTPWQLDALIVFLDSAHRRARVRRIENIVLNA